MKYHNKISWLGKITFFLLSVSSFSAQAKESEPLTIEQAKFQMVQLYLKEKVPAGKLRHKYPDLKKAADGESELRREYTKAIQNHPKLKPQFEAVDKKGLSIAEKMKHWQPIFDSAKDLEDLNELAEKYKAARIHSLREEIKAMKSEGFDDLAAKMTAILDQVK